MSNRLQQLFQFHENNPNDSFILFALAKEYEKLEDIPNAFKYYHLLRDEHKDYVGTYYHLAKLYEKVEKFDEAIQTYTVGMEIAKAQGDMHAYGEMSGAKWEIDDDE